MAIDPRVLIANEKRMPSSLSGDSGKVLKVNAAEDGYEHVAESAVGLTGEIKMWPLDTPPSGFLMCDGAAIDVGYTALIALVGANTPNITFAKNSKGTNTNTTEAESVGTHGHTASAVADHGHTITATSIGGHTHTGSSGGGGGHSHSTGGGVGANTVVSSASPRNINMYHGNATGSVGDHSHSVSVGSGGAHNHPVSAAVGGGHTPTIVDHSGTNQPACTLVNFIIKT